MQCFAIVGVGLIGGSVAAAIRRAQLPVRLIGIDSVSDLEGAVQAGLLDEYTHDWSMISSCDVIILAVPASQVPCVMQQIQPHLMPTAVVTDVGSTKCDVVAYARQYLGEAIGRFVPAHPIAGTEQSGWRASCADLFDGRQVILTPLEETCSSAIQCVSALWFAVGAQVVHVSPEEHDMIFASVSHLPHVLAFTLLTCLSKTPDYLSYAGPGFRDFSRIASGSPTLWRDICLANQDALLSVLTAYQEQLAHVELALRQQDGEALTRLFQLSQNTRAHWLSSSSSVE